MIIRGGGVCDTTHPLLYGASQWILNSPDPRDLNATTSSGDVLTVPTRHVLFTIIILYVRRFRRHVQYRSLFCIIIFHGRILPRANVSIVATLQLASVGNNNYDCACVFPRWLRITEDDVIEVTWETHLRSRHM